ncbi:MAG TPA: lipocalin-like domain-containing protein [Opitutaceae bacterium]|nr:lipocalin-like domain-containing protein [Opitutaceae bacterium]
MSFAVAIRFVFRRAVAAGLLSVVGLALQLRGDFRVPQPNPEFHFPADHGSHPDFPLEWWYVTGHLYDERNERFGFQATFFRQVSEDGSERETLHLAHMAVLDVSRKNFIYQTRLNRDGWDAASAVGKLSAHNGNWSIVMEKAPSERIDLIGGVRSEASFALKLNPKKPVVLFGDKGYSRKGEGADAASYYLTFSRLETSGTLRIRGEDMKVHGTSWMDHEISSSRLGEGLIGWDWVCIQFLDGRELMMYRLRHADGSSDPASMLTWVDATGATRKESFAWRPLSTWTSVSTGGRYPSTVELSTRDPQSGGAVKFSIEPLLLEQELAAGPGGIAYWEGACRVRDASGKEIGSAYMELTGYVKPLKLTAK